MKTASGLSPSVLKAVVVDDETRAAHWAPLIRKDLASSVEAILRTAHRFIAAKAVCAHGEFGKLFDKDGPDYSGVGDSSAQHLMAIARHAVLGNPERVPVLPPSWGTLYELSKAEPAQVEDWIADGRITPETERKHVQELRNAIRRSARPGDRRRAAGGDDLEIRHGDFREVLADIPDESVPLILTDPPYADVNLPLYVDLAAFAATKLVDGGSLICYTGHSLLPAVMPAMSEHCATGGSWRSSTRRVLVRCLAGGFVSDGNPSCGS